MQNRMTEKVFTIKKIGGKTDLTAAKIIRERHYIIKASICQKM